MATRDLPNGFFEEIGNSYYATLRYVIHTAGATMEKTQKKDSVEEIFNRWDLFDDSTQEELLSEFMIRFKGNYSRKDFLDFLSHRGKIFTVIPAEKKQQEPDCCH